MLCCVVLCCVVLCCVVHFSVLHQKVAAVNKVVLCGVEGEGGRVRRGAEGEMGVVVWSGVW